MKRYIMWLMASASMLMSGCFYQYPVYIHDPGAQPVIINNPPYPQYYVDQDRMHQRITAAEQANKDLTTQLVQLTEAHRRELELLRTQQIRPLYVYVQQPTVAVQRQYVVPRPVAIHMVNILARDAYLGSNPATYDDLTYFRAELSALRAPVTYVDPMPGYYIRPVLGGPYVTYDMVMYP